LKQESLKGKTEEKSKTLSLILEKMLRRQKDRMKMEGGKNKNLKCGNQVRAEMTTTAWLHSNSIHGEDTEKGIRIM
jgi:hypothetical protein